MFTADASVVIRWLIPGEEHEEKALRLRNDYAEGAVELNAPTLLVYEVSNGLWKAIERNSVRAEDAFLILQTFLKIKPESVLPDPDDVKKAMGIAVASHISFYDASYIATAMKTKSTLVTADENLYNIANKYVKTIHVKDY